MSYDEIFYTGWSLNVVVFFINLTIAIKTFSSSNKEKLKRENLILKDLKLELDKYHPNRSLITVFAYVLPFAAFLKKMFRFTEMYFFFQKNSKAKMFDYIVYKYQSEISRAKS